MNEPAAPTILYHYATQDALLGILKERALFATKIRYFDDADELIGPLRIALDTLKQNAKEPTPNDRCGKIVRYTQWAIEQSLNINICVVSFTAQPDSAHFWEKYADRGCGYAIGLDSGRLRQGAHPYLLRPCEYLDDDAQREKIHGLIASELDCSSPAEGDPLWLRLMDIATTLKSQRFAVEDEWRLVPRSAHWQDLLDCNCTYLTCDVRPGEHGLIPYWRLPIDLSWIVKVVIGPCLDAELAADGVKALIHKFQLDEGIEITHSKSRLT